jgi:hypothetical protein
LEVLSMRRLLGCSLAVIGVAIGLAGASQATPLANQSGFSANQVVITFDDVAGFTEITNQYTPRGVTFSGPLYSWPFNFYWHYLSVTWPGSGHGVAGMSWPNPKNITATFSRPVARAGFDMLLRATSTAVRLTAYRDNVVVDTQLIITVRWPQVRFIGIEELGGFDKLVIESLSEGNTKIVLMDDFRFDPTCDQQGDQAGSFDCQQGEPNGANNQTP